jgi:hypothetical protein
VRLPPIPIVFACGICVFQPTRRPHSAIGTRVLSSRHAAFPPTPSRLAACRPHPRCPHHHHRCHRGAGGKSGNDPARYRDRAPRRRRASVEELQRALDFPWEKWTIFLHPEQRQWVERDYSGPARVSGSAGTGKTMPRTEAALPSSSHQSLYIRLASLRARVQPE